jgi:hypothetical protein
MDHTVEMHPDAVARMDQLCKMHRQAQQKLRQHQQPTGENKAPQPVKATVDPHPIQGASS